MNHGAYRIKLSRVVCLSVMSFANRFSASAWVTSVPLATLYRMRPTRHLWNPLSTAISFPTLTSADRKSSAETTAIQMSDSNLEIDAEGRLIRTTISRRQSSRSGRGENEWDAFDPLQPSSGSENQRRYGRGGWVDDREGWDITGNGSGLRPRSKLSSNRRAPPAINRRQDRQRLDSSDRKYDPKGRWTERSNRKTDSSSEEYNRVNSRNLELAGFDHLYGLSSVLNALQANVRNFAPLEFIHMDEGDETTGNNNAVLPLKPEAQMRPFLFVQDPGNNRGSSLRTSDKQVQANKILHLAEQYNIPISYVDKGVLNTLSNNRPHQGFVLRCGKLNFNDRTISKIPLEHNDPENYKSFWLVLDEVVDPQNLGAILRTAFFLGGGLSSSSMKLGVLICQKNSAPPSAVVSAASAGALELLMQNDAIYSTNNLMRTLSIAEQDGCRIVGASSSVPYDSVDVPLYDLQDLPVVPKLSEEPLTHEHPPTLLVLGSEGHGLRSLVAKCCTEFVRIPSANAEVEEVTGTSNINTVDSLNVSVTAGILLWHFAHEISVDRRKS